MKKICWQYCKDLNDINTAIETQDKDWYGLKSAEQIISITWEPNHSCYVVFWMNYTAPTNADFIRAMTDDELADFLESETNTWKVTWVKWLKQEVQE